MESHAYFNLPIFIEKLRNDRGKLHDANLNFTIILLSTIIIESALYDLLNLSIGDSFHEDTIDGRMLHEIKKRINKATWKDYKELSVLIIGKKLNDCVGNDLWESIQCLFEYRNYIVHGNPFKFDKNSISGKYEHHGKMKRISEFLVKKGLYKMKKSGLLNSEIADFFWDHTKKFVLKISKKLKNENNEIVFLMFKNAINNTGPLRRPIK